jgi:predicted CoA-binding protein
VPATRDLVDDFVSQRTLALVGMSRGGRKFGNAAYTELTAKGYTVLPVHPDAETIGGARCWPSLAALPGTPGGVLVVVPPARAAKVVEEAYAAGIPRVWLQQGAESPEAVRFGAEHGMRVVQGECILMFAEPAAWFHRAHRAVNRFLGKLPR